MSESESYEEVPLQFLNDEALADEDDIIAKIMEDKKSSLVRAAHTERASGEHRRLQEQGARPTRTRGHQAPEPRSRATLRPRFPLLLHRTAR
jgi:hypothetical protein